MTMLLVVAGVTVLISSMCSLFEATLYSTRTGSLEAERAEGKHARLAERLIAMKANIARPTSAILILNTVANTAGATICGMYAAQVLGSVWVPAFSVGLTVAILFVGEILPKTYGATHWRDMWHLIVWPLTLMQKGFSPLIRVTQAFSGFFTGGLGVPAVTEDEIRADIHLGRKAGELSASELQLLNAVFHFDDMLARQVMVARRDVVFFDVHWSLEKCLEVAKETRHTRFPLCIGSLDEVVGLVHVKDLLGLTDDEGILRSVARPIRHIPETLPISRLLREMQSTHQQMALVDDEFGSVVGVITMENVVEQIVGAVQDEFDSEPPEIVPEGADTFKVSGQLPIERVNRELGLDLYAPDVDTLSGLLVSRLNRLLKVGDRVRLRNVIAEVVEEQGGRAAQVRMRIAQGDEGEEIAPEKSDT
ncbi:MAG: hemolysin family protein [Desulfurellaceae bacterium]|nr:hemolysin family protein [Desulfurellaceae bacterium]